MDSVRRFSLSLSLSPSSRKRTCLYLDFNLSLSLPPSFSFLFPILLLTFWLMHSRAAFVILQCTASAEFKWIEAREGGNKLDRRSVKSVKELSPPAIGTVLKPRQSYSLPVARLQFGRREIEDELTLGQVRGDHCPASLFLYSSSSPFCFPSSFIPTSLIFFCHNQGHVGVPGGGSRAS